MSERQEQIGFKLPRPYVAELEKRGEENGMSKHQFARRLVIEAIADTNTHRILDKISQLDEKTDDRWEDILTAVANLFIHAGKLSTEEAVDWVETNMPS